MVIVMETSATEEQIQDVIARLGQLGFNVHRSTGTMRTVLGAIGDKADVDLESLAVLPGVHEVTPISRPYKLASRESRQEATQVTVSDVTIGGDEVVVMAGPCSVESESQLLETAYAVREAGAKILRGGAFKPRTSPYSFRGMGREGLEILARAREATGLAVITEVMSANDVDMVGDFTDIYQVGTRNMYNYVLLDALGKTRKPVLLKRGLSATLEEWILAGEYLLAGGNPDVMLCERGIRTFETYTRNTFDISAFPALKRESHLPTIADPSQGTGRAFLVEPASMAAVAAGADGLLVEVHPDPAKALSDGAQSLNFRQFEQFMERVRAIAEACGRVIAPAAAPIA
jgi:3-deoxy-7-phosphoheptulonate synthase